MDSGRLFLPSFPVVKHVVCYVSALRFTVIKFQKSLKTLTYPDFLLVTDWSWVTGSSGVQVLNYKY